LISQLFHTQEVLLPIFFRHNDRVLNDKITLHQQKKISKTSLPQKKQQSSPALCQAPAERHGTVPNAE